MGLTQRIWYGGSPLKWLLWPVSLIFRLVSFLRRAAYRKGLLSRYRSSVPVIVVGNISVGGNGKTPLVIFLVQRLRELGFRPGVVSRGYGGHAPSYPCLLDPDTLPAVSGDEPFLIHARLGCPVVVDPVRSRGVQLLERQGVDVIVSDDGLQHYALDRDIELVVTDGTRRFGNGEVLPMGPLREGLWRRLECDAVICNGGTPASGELAMDVIPGTPVRVSDPGTPLEGRPAVAALAGIGNPEKFFSLLERMGFTVERKIRLPDHAAPGAAGIARILGDWQGVVMMTEKDAVKCRQDAPDNWYFLPVDARVDPALMDLIRQRLEALQKGRTRDPGDSGS